MPALQKSFGSFEIKSTNEEKRTFKGIASTPNADRAKDIMVPRGAKFELPMPLLFIMSTALRSVRSLMQRLLIRNRSRDSYPRN